MPKVKIRNNFLNTTLSAIKDKTIKKASPIDLETLNSGWMRGNKTSTTITWSTVLIKKDITCLNSV